MALFGQDRSRTEDELLQGDAATRALSVTAVENDFVERVYEKLASVYDLTFGPTLHPGRVQAVDVDAPDVYNPDDMHEALHYVVPMLVAIFQAPPAARPAVPFGAPVVLSAINEYGDR